MAKAIPRIKVVLLDADGVLQQPGCNWQSSLEALCADPGRSREFLAEVFAAERPCLTGAQDFAEALGSVLSKWGCTATAEEALSVWTLIDPDPHAMRLVKGLRARGIRVALASNQQSRRAEFMSERLRYSESFDHLFFSCHLGHAKPSLNFFKACLERLDVRANEALFIDDHGENVAAARYVGMHAEVFHLRDGSSRLSSILLRYGLTDT